MLRAITRVQTWSGPRILTSASGFFFQREGRLFLVTSRHVLFDKPSGHGPDSIEVTCHTDAVDLTRVQSLRLPLYADDHACWQQAQDSGGDIDVAVIAITQSQLPQPNAMQVFGPQDLAEAGQTVDVGDSLAIPSFPLGFHDTVHHLPVVRMAGLASAYGVRFQGRGYFLTDGRTHRGSSGAPVLVHTPGPECTRRWRLLGIHSSRMDMSDRDAKLDESLGLNCAWYADVLMTLTQTSAGGPA